MQARGGCCQEHRLSNRSALLASHLADQGAGLGWGGSCAAWPHQLLPAWLAPIHSAHPQVRMISNFIDSPMAR